MSEIDKEMCVCFGKGKVKVRAVVRMKAGFLQASFVSKGVHLSLETEYRNTKLTKG